MLPDRTNSTIKDKNFFKNAKIEQFEGFYFSYYKIELDIEELAKWMIYSIDMSILFEIKYLVSFSSSNFRLWLS